MVSYVPAFGLLTAQYAGIFSLAKNYLRGSVRDRSIPVEKSNDEADRLKHPMSLERSCTDVLWLQDRKAATLQITVRTVLPPLAAVMPTEAAWLACFVACIFALSTLSFAVRIPKSGCSGKGHTKFCPFPPLH